MDKHKKLETWSWGTCFPLRFKISSEFLFNLKVVSHLSRGISVMQSIGKQLQVKNVFENNEVYPYCIYRKAWKLPSIVFLFHFLKPLRNLMFFQAINMYFHTNVRWILCKHYSLFRLISSSTSPVITWFIAASALGNLDQKSYSKIKKT